MQMCPTRDIWQQGNVWQMLY
ncbi:hypothetical protein Goklo_023713 [Gossypium klotzschianum]|uniref:Uncharacterized protein n=1 Tax=Gossypium klotzschianum TaxID=34286 RepID=A0A7J8TRQ2_9ROSI|nr:hypothetical protein [Gossypium klotzschianum]